MINRWYASKPWAELRATYKTDWHFVTEGVSIFTLRWRGKHLEHWQTVGLGVAPWRKNNRTCHFWVSLCLSPSPFFRVRIWFWSDVLCHNLFNRPGTCFTWTTEPKDLWPIINSLFQMLKYPQLQRCFWSTRDNKHKKINLEKSNTKITSVELKHWWKQGFSFYLLKWSPFFANTVIVHIFIKSSCWQLQKNSILSK